MVDTRASSGCASRTGGRTCLQQRGHGGGVAVEGEAERVVGEQPGGGAPVAGGLQVGDGVDGLPVCGVPAGREPVQLGHLGGLGAAQLQGEHVGDEAVVAKPRPAGVEGDHERVGVFQVEQDPFRPGGAGEQVGQLAVDPVEQAGAQQQPLDVGGLAVEHLGHQVLGDGAVAAGEVRDEPRRVGVAGQRECGQP